MFENEDTFEFMPTTCEWISQDGTNCTAHTSFGLSYCAAHRSQAYITVSENLASSNSITISALTTMLINRNKND